MTINEDPSSWTSTKPLPIPKANRSCPPSSATCPRHLVVLGRLEGWSGALRARFKSRVRLTRELKTEVGALYFVHLIAHGMA